MITNAILFILWFLIWELLCWPMDRYDIVIGIFVALFVTFMTADFFTSKHRLKRKFTRYAWFVYYTAVFLWECVKANIDVAFRVLHPDMPIRPGTFKIKINLKSDAGITFLANSITLTPGTTSVDVDRDNGFLYVHWLYVKEDYDKKSMALPVVTRFENILRRIFE